MTAVDLRVGNKLRNTIFQTNVTVKGIVWFSSEETHRINCGFGVIDISTLTPIPLTEDILLKCGFVKRDILGGLYEKEYTQIFLNDLGNFEVVNDYKTCIKHLHTLQNLIHALTGKELEVNL